VDPTEAYTSAQLLESYNKRRRALTDAAMQTALARITDDPDGPYLYFVADEGFQPGIVGLVAGKLTGESYRPSAVVEIGPDESRGSARSIPEVDISAALDSVSDLLLRYGGHSRAAGFTVATERLDELRVALTGAIATQLADIDPGMLRPTLEIDAEVPYAALDWALVDQFARLEPTGQANPQPLLLCRSVRVREARAVGQKKHLKLVLDAGPRSRVLDGIAFGFGEMARQLSDGSRLDLVFGLEVNVWQERRRLQLNIQDLRLNP
jgi:single-stranded-DNA-specific exonuclease